MIHILLEGYDIDAPWLFSELQRYIRPHHRVAVLAFSFRDSQASCLADWELLYGRKQGRYTGGITGGFASFGIGEEQISFVNYFADTREEARRKIQSADILYFPGGLPDRMMDRIREFGLEEPILSHKGIVMGYSAGALIQLAEYHLSPDEDYPEFQYARGLPLLNGFYLEVHYENTEPQNAAIQRVLEERKKPVYATEAMKGAILVENGTVRLLGTVKRCEP